MHSSIASSPKIKLRLEELQSDVQFQYDQAIRKEKDTRFWKLILDIMKEILTFVINQGLKIKWYSPIVILSALKSLKNIVGLVIQYVTERN